MCKLAASASAFNEYARVEHVRLNSLHILQYYMEMYVISHNHCTVERMGLRDSSLERMRQRCFEVVFRTSISFK